MNFSAYTHLSCQPWGWSLAVMAMMFLFGITAEAKMPAACPVVRVVGDISFGGIHTVEIGVTEKSAGGARGSAAGIPFSIIKNNAAAQPSERAKLLMSPPANGGKEMAVSPSLRSLLATRYSLPATAWRAHA